MPIKLSSLKTHDLSSRPQLQVTCNIQPQQQFDSTTPKTKQHIFGNIIGWRGAPSQKKTIQSGRFPSRSLSLSIAFRPNLPQPFSSAHHFCLFGSYYPYQRCKPTRNTHILAVQSPFWYVKLPFSLDK